MTRLTLEREQEIRFGGICTCEKDIPELLAEIDALRDELKLASYLRGAKLQERVAMLREALELYSDDDILEPHIRRNLAAQALVADAEMEKK